MLALDGFVFSQVAGFTPSSGEIIHGSDYTGTRVALTGL
jgi:hypothetical protein